MMPPSRIQRVMRAPPSDVLAVCLTRTILVLVRRPDVFMKGDVVESGERRNVRNPAIRKADVSW